MKQLFLPVIIVLFLGLQSNAQTRKNWYLIGGKISNIGLDFQQGNTAFSFNISPTVAWFVTDNFALGAQALIGLSTGTGFTTVQYGIGPIARYYLTNRAINSIRRTRLFFEGNVGFNGTNTKVSGTPSTTTNGLGIGFGPGLAFFLNDNIALEALAKYNLTVGFGNSLTDNAINLSLGFQIYLPQARLKALKKEIK